MSLQRSLRQHRPRGPEEAADLARILAFVERHPSPFDRSLAEGHLTGSALVVAASGEAFLLLHHRKLGLWLQPGGHGEAGERTGEEVALREAREETGLPGLHLHPTAPRPFDVDVHRIPERPGEPAHLHLDLRYLVLAPVADRLRFDPAESHDGRWFGWGELEALGLDPGLRRALGKARELMAPSRSSSSETA
jgi:8-oxo-dGTP pyrophosphatase MutT (NUDIX family)